MTTAVHTLIDSSAAERCSSTIQQELRKLGEAWAQDSNEIRALRDQLFIQKQENTSLRKTVDAMKETIAATSEASSAVVTDVTKECSLQQDYLECVAALEDSRQEIQALQGQVASLQTQMEAQKQRLLREWEEAAGQAKARLLKDHEEMQERMRSLSDASQSRHQQALEKANELQAKVKSLESKLEHHAQLQADAARALSSRKLEDAEKRQADARRSYEQQLADLRSQLAESERRRAAAEEAVEKQRASFSSALANLQAQSRDSAARKARVQELRKELDQAIKQRDHYQAMLAAKGAHHR